jgi:hypothetical protein
MMIRSFAVMLVWSNITVILRESQEEIKEVKVLLLTSTEKIIKAE